MPMHAAPIRSADARPISDAYSVAGISIARIPIHICSIVIDTIDRGPGGSVSIPIGTTSIRHDGASVAVSSVRICFVIASILSVMMMVRSTTVSTHFFQVGVTVLVFDS